MNSQYDFVIIGSGPAGLAAAVTADELGLKTALFDEQFEPGGQIYRSMESSVEENEPVLGDDYLCGKPLVNAFRNSSAEYIPGTTVWNLDRTITLDVLTDQQARRVEARHIMIGVGALERPVPIPGWTLPGVMGAAAADILFKSADMIPGEKVVLAGSGPLLLLVACHLVDNGVKLAAMVETSGYREYFKSLPYLPGALRLNHYLRKGLMMRLKVKRAGAPLFLGCRDLAVLGDEQAEGLRFTYRGKTKEVAAATVLLHEGVIPNLRLGQLVGCEHEWYDPQRYWRPVLDRWGRTSVAGISVAGDAGGVWGVKVAEASGHLAALDVACRLQVISASERDRRAAPYEKTSKREKLIRPFLDHVFPPSRQALVPPDDSTIICRCEELTARQIREAVALGARDPGQVKGQTRAGMGPCQGRMCGATVAEIIAESSGVDIAYVGQLRVRPPIKPMTINQLADLEFPDEY
ncbi:MAG: FAD-dependent oxidoreductase [Deltaproteobacteria bacterium]|nr:FAD-dependent oxidoreductase [Deltaproteobacteria bacterium]